MNMGAPKGTQAPVAGLAALAQPATAPKGKSPENMGQIMALARKMSDAQLADVLNGKSLDVPQFAAMTEAMGRKQLRTAVQGQQAMAQAKQPSLRERMLAEANAGQMQQMPAVDTMGNVTGYAEGGSIDMNESANAAGGLAELPAPNMEGLTLAGGGIIAFEDGGEVQHFQNKGKVEGEPEFGTDEYNEKYGAPGSMKRMFKGVKDYYASPSSMEGVGRNITNTANAIAPVSFGAGVTGGQFIPKTGGIITNIADIGRKIFGTTGAANMVLGNDSQALPVPEGNAEPAPSADKKAAGPAAGPAGGGGGGGGGGGSADKTGGLGDLASYEDLLKKRSTDYLSKFEGMGDKKRQGLKDLQSQLQGQLALQASSALLKNRNLASAGADFGERASATVGAGRAEKRALEDTADQYDFNIAKAREAAEKGDMQLALQYQQLASQSKYQTGMIDMYKQRNAIMGEAGNLGKVQTGLLQADKQALAEAKQRFPVVTKSNQAAYDQFLRKRAMEIKMGNPLTKQYANLGAGDLGNSGFNVVQSLPKGASVVDLES
jgi:hypothetical protein